MLETFLTTQIFPAKVKHITPGKKNSCEMDKIMKLVVVSTVSY